LGEEYYSCYDGGDSEEYHSSGDGTDSEEYLSCDDGGDTSEEENGRPQAVSYSHLIVSKLIFFCQYKL
jgi:hypothetical protein